MYFNATGDEGNTSFYMAALVKWAIKNIIH